MRRQLPTGILVILAMTVLVGFVYPLGMTAIAQLAFRDRANGSLVTRNGEAVGSALLGQSFSSSQYFHPRPSAAGTKGYDALASGASNLGPTNERLIGECVPVLPTDADGIRACDADTVPERAAAYRRLNGLAPDAAVPVDAVTASGSGLDPHISVANARLQAGRIADARGIPVLQIDELLDVHTSGRPLGFLGEPAVNVLELNLALDRAAAG